MKPGDKVYVAYEGEGTIIDIDYQYSTCHVKIDSDGVIVAASFAQILPAKTE